MTKFYHPRPQTRSVGTFMSKVVRCQNNACRRIKRYKNGRLWRVKILAKPWFTEDERKYCLDCLVDLQKIVPQRPFNN